MAGLLREESVSNTSNFPKNIWPDWSQPPSAMESMIPIWGSAREAIADYNAGNYAGALLNSVLAVSDLNILAAAGRGIAKGAFKTGSHTWGATRKWMQKNDHVQKGYEGHHWLFKQNEGVGKYVPEVIKHQPWNVMSLPKDVHRRLHYNWKGENKFTAAERYWYGTPAWSKDTTLSISGRSINDIDDEPRR